MKLSNTAKKILPFSWPYIFLGRGGGGEGGFKNELKLAEIQYHLFHKQGGDRPKSSHGWLIYIALTLSDMHAT